MAYACCICVACLLVLQEALRGAEGLAAAGAGGNGAALAEAGELPLTAALDLMFGMGGGAAGQAAAQQQDGERGGLLAICQPCGSHWCFAAWPMLRSRTIVGADCFVCRPHRVQLPTLPRLLCAVCPSAEEVATDEEEEEEDEEGSEEGSEEEEEEEEEYSDEEGSEEEEEHGGLQVGSLLPLICLASHGVGRGQQPQACNVQAGLRTRLSC